MVSAKSKALGLPEISNASTSCVKTTENEQMPVFVINLDADGQRLAAMREQLDSLGLTWERIPAMDGACIAPGEMLQENRRARLRRLSAGEIGCLRSHVAVWHRLAEGRAPAALVLEDDVLLAPDSALFAKDSNWLPSNDCIVRLETFRMPVVLGPHVKVVNRRGLYPLRSIQHGSAAYVITAKRAHALLQAYSDYVDPADCFMFRYPWKHNVYQLSPAPCIQQDIYKYGRHFNNEDSRLENERLPVLRGSRFEPRSIRWKVGAAVRIGFDVAMGHSLRIVPYG